MSQRLHEHEWEGGKCSLCGMPDPRWTAGPRIFRYEVDRFDNAMTLIFLAIGPIAFVAAIVLLIIKAISP
jgi:hypothetical protein